MSASQIGNVGATSDFSGLAHDIFVGDVVPHARRMSPSASVFNDAGPGDYRLLGTKMKFAARLHDAVGGAATDGKVPDHIDSDAVQGELTPIRRYHRIAMDNLTKSQVTGEGAFEDISTFLFDEFWAAWKNMEIRQAIGSSTGYIAKVSSRTSSTVVVLKDGFGHAGTNPISHIAKNAIVSWWDVDQAQVGGAAKISNIDETNNTVTLDSAATWETAVGNAIAADDFIMIATTNSTASAHFVTERNLAPYGFGTIVDPDASISTAFNIAESNYPRWKPVRRTGGTVDHLAVSDFFEALGTKRREPVTPGTDVALAHGAVIRQVARSLMGYQQQAYTGGDLRGGHGGVFVDGIPLVPDPYFYHDVLAVLYKPALYRVNLGGEPGFYDQDGSEWSRMADYDGQDGFASEYMNFFTNQRGYHGAMVGLVVSDVTTSDYDAPRTF